MTVRVDYRKPGIGKYLELEDNEWRSETFGLVNKKGRGETDPRIIRELEEAEELNYSNSTQGMIESLAQKFYGGAIETSYGTREWIGPVPEDARQYLQKVRDSIR